MRNGSLLRFDISLPVNAIEKVLLDSPRSVRSLFPFRHFHLEIPLHPPRTKLKNSRKKQEEQYRRRPKKKKQISMAEPLPPPSTLEGGVVVSSTLRYLSACKGIKMQGAPSDYHAQTMLSQFPLGRSQKPLGFWPSTQGMSGIDCQPC